MSGYIYLGAACCAWGLYLSNRRMKGERAVGFPVLAGLVFLAALVLRLLLGY